MANKQEGFSDQERRGQEIRQAPTSEEAAMQPRRQRGVSRVHDPCAPRIHECRMVQQSEDTAESEQGGTQGVKNCEAIVRNLK